MIHNTNKLHLGCGKVNFDGWLNIDIATPTADMLLNLTKPLPFEDDSVSHIFNEHFIEHISRTEAVAFLSECRRILKPDGVIRLTTPNLRFLISSYCTFQKDEWGELWQPKTRCSMLNEGMRSWGHQFVYDDDELVRIFLEAGFHFISFQEYRSSQYNELCNLETRPFNNELIIEARKSEESIQSIEYQVARLNEDQWPSKLNHKMMEHIKIAERTLMEQVSYIQSIEKTIAARGEVIAEQNNYIQKFQKSIFGKCYFALSRLSSFIKA